MKKYHVFIRPDDEYPSGGMGDYSKSYEKLETALEHIQEHGKYYCWGIAETQEDGSLKEIANNYNHTIEET